MEGQKVVFATEMSRIEAKAIAEGDGSSAEYMSKAAEGIYEVVLNHLHEKILKEISKDGRIE